MYKNIIILLILSIPLFLKAEILYTSNSDIQSLDLNKENNLHAQIHDYINNISYYCDIEKLDNEYWRSGTFQLPEENDSLKKACSSLKENKIEVICQNYGLLLNEHRRPKGIPSFYPVTSEKLAKEGTTFRGFSTCFLNKDFQKNNISFQLYVEYKLDKVTKFHKMADPRDRSKKIKIIQSAKLIPNIQEMSPRYEIIIVD
tara:strand:- start:1351 stop:1953 length:603 start_codon:yes stop_codon:yes gene_type:complete